MSVSISPSYSLQQQIYCLNFMSNAGFGIRAASYDALQTDVTAIVNAALQNSQIQSCIGSDWQLLWGPIVFSNNTTGAYVVADNTMMLLYSPSQSTIVVAIAGTNVDSMYGWEDEDFNVSSLVPWTTVVGGSKHIPPGASVSAGTSDGLSKLLAMTDPDKNGITMITALADFLGQADTPGRLQLAVSGHSLGGALSPAMALYLQNIQDNGNDWDTKGNVNMISAWPTAGPTPGELEFSLYLPLALSKYTSLHNSIDIVPHAWQPDTLAMIPDIYNPNLPTSLVIEGIVADVALKTAKVLPHVYTQSLLWTALNGTFDQTTDTNCQTAIANLETKYPLFAKEIAALAPVIRFMGQAAYQHTVAYTILLNIETYAEGYAAAKKTVDPTSETIEEIIITELVRYVEKRLHINVEAPVV